MVKKIFIGFAFLFFVAETVCAAGNRTTVEVDKGEKWWGLTYNVVAGEGMPQGQPFSEPFKISGDDVGAIMTPVLVSSAGRYIYVPDMTGIEFDGEKFTITTKSDSGVKVEKAGKTLREAYVVCALKNFTPGKTPDHALFALPLYRTDHELGFVQGEEEIVAYAEKLVSAGFPAGVMVICDGWQNINGPYAFDNNLYPDPKRMVDRLHSMGFKVMLTVSPYIPAWGKVYGDAAKKGQLVKTSRELLSSKLPAVTDKALLDISGPEQFERMRAGLGSIRDNVGFDGFLFDCGDSPLVSPEFRRNMMSLGEGIGFSIYSYGESETYAPHVEAVTSVRTSGDLVATLVGEALAGGLVGHPYMLFDFYGPSIMEAEKEMAGYLLFQCGMPVVNVEFAPWRITDKELYQGVKDALNFRASIGDYLRQLADESGRTGEPIVRHMEYQFPKQGFADCGDQFMLGTKYLVAPCVDGADKRLVRLPKGAWLDRNGEKIKGPVVKEDDCSQGLVWYESAN